MKIHFMLTRDELVRTENSITLEMLIVTRLLKHGIPPEYVKDGKVVEGTLSTMGAMHTGAISVLWVGPKKQADKLLHGQTKLGSFLEALLNTGIGFVISMLATVVILPAYGFEPTFEVNMKITFWFTLISIARSYCLRRLFNAQFYRSLWRR